VRGKGSHRVNEVIGAVVYSAIRLRRVTAMATYAVIDTETTGLQPSDRIVEFACTVLDGNGTAVSRMETIINPGRNPGATHVHGLTAAMVAHAPPFGALARHIVHLLNGRIIVAHNLMFDWMMLRKEFERLGACLPANANGVCTADLARTDQGRRGALRTACAALGLHVTAEHRAGSDVDMTVRLFQVLRVRVGTLPPHRAVVIGCRPSALPAPQRPLQRNDLQFPASAV
jgi:DNA polymerase-3 subunit epsilon